MNWEAENSCTTRNQCFSPQLLGGIEVFNEGTDRGEWKRRSGEKGRGKGRRMLKNGQPAKSFRTEQEIPSTSFENIIQSKNTARNIRWSKVRTSFVKSAIIILLVFLDICEWKI